MSRNFYVIGEASITRCLPATKNGMKQPNETVEKPILGRAFPVQGPTKRPNSRVAGSLRFFSLCQGLDQCPKSVDLANIVNQSE